MTQGDAKDTQGAGGKPMNGRQVQSNRAVASGRNGATSGYLEARIEGRPVQCLIDTGSDTSIFPLKEIRPEWLRKTHHTLRAANGALIPVKGEADVPISLPGLRSTVKAIITEHVSEPMVG